MIQARRLKPPHRNLYNCLFKRMVKHSTSLLIMFLFMLNSISVFFSFLSLFNRLRRKETWKPRISSAMLKGTLPMLSWIRSYSHANRIIELIQTAWYHVQISLDSFTALNTQFYTPTSSPSSHNPIAFEEKKKNFDLICFTVNMRRKLLGIGLNWAKCTFTMKIYDIYVWILEFE